MVRGVDPVIAAAPVVTVPATTFFRACTPHRLRVYNKSAFDGGWTGQRGGRFNSPGSDPTLYLAGCQTVATFETEQEAMLNNLVAPTPAPLVGVATVIRNARVVALTDGLGRPQPGA